MAEYIDGKIVVSNVLSYAKPNVLSCYILHEAVHGFSALYNNRENLPPGTLKNFPSASIFVLPQERDLTWLEEEKLAYREETTLWSKIHNDVIDPSLTMALFLSTSGRYDALDQKVTKLYTLNNPDLLPSYVYEHSNLPMAPTNFLTNTLSNIHYNTISL